MMGGNGISWTICKSYALHSRQITMPVATHHSVFTGWMPLLPPNQQRKSTEGKALCCTVTTAHICDKKNLKFILHYCNCTLFVMHLCGPF